MNARRRRSNRSLTASGAAVERRVKAIRQGKKEVEWITCKQCKVQFPRKPGPGRKPKFHTTTCRTRWWKDHHTDAKEGE